jgi:galactonate dehydratase
MAHISEITSFRVPPRWIFVRVRTSDGRAGWGESIVPKRARAVVAAIGEMAENLRGTDAGRIEEIAQRLRRGAFFRGDAVLATAAASIEQALWDIKGQVHGLPVHEFLGGPVRDRLRAYAWIGGDTPNDVVAEARKRIEQGFTAVKMHATGALGHIGERKEIDAAVARLAVLRETFGPELDVALDLSGRVHRSALKPLLAELEQFHPMWIEEPALPENEETLAVVARAAGSMPVATGERLTTRWEVKHLLDTGAVDIIQPDVSLTGLFELEKIARLAEIYDVAVAPHCPNGPISLAATLQVGFCCGNVVIQEQSLGLHYHHGYAGLPQGDLLDYLADSKPLTTVQGSFSIFTGPGLGVTLDAEKIEAKQNDWRLPDPLWRHPDGTYAEW